MEGILALHRIIISYKELSKSEFVDLTYNEFIVLFACNDKGNYVGNLNIKTLIDKGQLVRVLNNLIKKEIIGKKKESLGHSYFLLEEGRKIKSSINNRINSQDEGVPLSEEEKKARKLIIAYEKKLQQYTFNNTSDSKKKQ